MRVMRRRKHEDRQTGVRFNIIIRQLNAPKLNMHGASTY
jgi:hypothetical protein